MTQMTWVPWCVCLCGCAIVFSPFITNEVYSRIIWHVDACIFSVACVCVCVCVFVSRCVQTDRQTQWMN
jgi:Ca2+/H+ antiporter